MENEIEKCAKELLGRDFKFRPGQLEAISFAVGNALGDVKQTVVEAPTGSVSLSSR